jgi:hypothetical protein
LRALFARRVRFLQRGCDKSQTQFRAAWSQAYRVRSASTGFGYLALAGTAERGRKRGAERSTVATNGQPHVRAGQTRRISLHAAGRARWNVRL